jgi:hypothetical protein
MAIGSSAILEDLVEQLRAGFNRAFAAALNDRFNLSICGVLAWFGLKGQEKLNADRFDGGSR